MEKINFENLPSTKTPVSAENLNAMQSNIEKSVVAVGKTQPSTGENVWLKKGKNLFNKDILLSNVNILSSGEITADSNSVIHYVTVEAGVTYTISSNVNRQWVLSTSNTNPYLGQTNLTRTIVSGTSTQITIPAGHTYLYIRHYPTNNENNLTQNVQVERGSSATTYEPYVEKSIYTKNNQNVYEQFYTENKPVNYNIIATTTINSNLTAYATGYFDFSMYSEIVVQLGSGSEGDSVLFKIPSNPNNSNLINSVAHLDMYASSSYRCRAFTSLYFNSTSTGIVRVNPKQLTGWSSVAVTIKGVLK